MRKGMKCYNCGKGIMVGHEVSKAKNRTRKIFKPNLHLARIIVEGRPMRVRLCTKCGRQLKRQNSKVKIESQNLKSSEIKEASIRPVRDSQGKQAQDKEVSSIAPAVSGLA